MAKRPLNYLKSKLRRLDNLIARRSGESAAQSRRKNHVPLSVLKASRNKLARVVNRRG